jgi:hypothetical protein
VGFGCATVSRCTAQPGSSSKGNVHFTNLINAFPPSRSRRPLRPASVWRPVEQCPELLLRTRTVVTRKANPVVTDFKRLPLSFSRRDSIALCFHIVRTCKGKCRGLWHDPPSTETDQSLKEVSSLLDVLKSISILIASISADISRCAEDQNPGDNLIADALTDASHALGFRRRAAPADRDRSPARPELED